MRLPYPSKDPLRPELLIVEERIGNGEYGAAMRTECSGDSRIEPEQQAAGRLPAGT